MTDVLVLCYHAVSDRWDSSISITPERLEEQLRFLTKKGYRGTTFHDAVTAPPSRKNLVVTFDDAFLSVFEIAFPILSRLEVPGTLFVPTRMIGNDGPMSWEGIDSWIGTPHEGELVGMSWEQVEGLAGAGWEIGSHTQSHRHLTALNDEALENELRGSREDCEQRLGTPCHSIAYPFGDVDDRVVNATRRAGYSVAGSIEPVVLYPPAPLNWPRVGVYFGTDWSRFRRSVSPSWRRLRNSWLWPSLDRVRRKLRPKF
jgi:peptidoglycan/xylan/chitin deacetylase (PgdA/CDA1 family)